MPVSAEASIAFRRSSCDAFSLLATATPASDSSRNLYLSAALAPLSMPSWVAPSGFSARFSWKNVSMSALRLSAGSLAANAGATDQASTADVAGQAIAADAADEKSSRRLSMKASPSLFRESIYAACALVRAQNCRKLYQGRYPG